MFKTIIAVFAGLVFTSPASAQAPVISAQSSDAIVEVGQTASFGVNVTSNGLAVNFQWYRNGSPIDDGTGEAASYTTPIARLQDNGTVFFVLVSDELGETASQAIILNVVSPPGAFAMVLNPSNAVTKIGAPANFTLGVENSTGQLITLGCQSSVPNSFCLLSENQIVHGDVNVQILTGSTQASVHSVPTIWLWLLGTLAVCALLSRRKFLPAALMIVTCAAGCNQMPVPAPAVQPAALTYSFTITGTINTGLQQVAVGTVTIQSK